jgi:hypothetical protein
MTDLTTTVDGYLAAWNERGLDVADLAADGRLARVVGFFGELDPHAR